MVFRVRRGTVNSEIFVRILFSRIALKDIFSMLKNCDFGLINLHQKRTKRFRYFAWVLFSRNSVAGKFRKNKTLAKISEFTVLDCIDS